MSALPPGKGEGIELPLNSFPQARFKDKREASRKFSSMSKDRCSSGVTVSRALCWSFLMVVGSVHRCGQ
eukprot:7541394-Pyramimonas_sp.AAC.1